MNPIDRFKDYKETHCWQYEIRKRNFEEDVCRTGFSETEIENLKVREFEVKYIDKVNKEECEEVKNFILRHEWLGKLPNRPTHRFGAYYKGQLAGVVIMATPNAFSYVLGKEMSGKEKLISRGACISWSPKNLGSYLVQKSIDWMVRNTEFRIFSAYSDPEAREIGSIYKALNFIYLGQSFGAGKMYLDHTKPKKGWFSSREFRKVSSYKRYALELEIAWRKEWGQGGKMNWSLVPSETQIILREHSRIFERRCLSREVKQKHKYIKIQGEDKRELKKLLKLFQEHNPKLNFVRKDGLLIGTQYPQTRGI